MGVAGKEWGDISGVVVVGGGSSFYIKNKLKSEMFCDKRSLSTKMFLSVITKNLNWETLTRI